VRNIVAANKVVDNISAGILKLMETFLLHKVIDFIMIESKYEQTITRLGRIEESLRNNYNVVRGDL
jgi:hypothetical protein